LEEEWEKMAQPAWVRNVSAIPINETATRLTIGEVMVVGSVGEPGRNCNAQIQRCTWWRNRL
jgi:hypothetical protein